MVSEGRIWQSDFCLRKFSTEFATIYLKLSDVKSRYQKLLNDYNELDLQTLPKPKIEVDFFPTN